MILGFLGDLEILFGEFGIFLGCFEDLIWRIGAFICSRGEIRRRFRFYVYSESILIACYLVVLFGSI